MDLLLSILPILFAITIHEYAHAYVAYRLGDPTAYLAGRLTLNPLRHIDPIGALVFLITRFGWAKPVPVDHSRLGKYGMRWVSLAGPVSNFIVGILSAIVVRFIPYAPPFTILSRIFLLSFLLNITFGLFNLIPIPPLDGSHILESYLPYYYRLQYRRWAVYGPILLIMIIVFDRMTGLGILWGWIGPILNLLSQLIIGHSIFYW
ncbi:site-2 protease family protein [candidate division WOR-3 bacterium]|mgnify:CR=1 FL=1|uniref:Site-2 protease family protein n=1 Tax=candidate division WOR-3 bacterium TaxID=2052148 RepID=A0A660SH91_UNCW3|nr:MAG: site-2 protease family protein [candidate division WOR-3 bacterium]